MPIRTMNRRDALSALKAGCELRHYFSTETARLELDGEVLGVLRWDSVYAMVKEGTLKFVDNARTISIFRQLVLTEKGVKS